MGRWNPFRGWGQPTCPIDPAAKAWIEQRLHWLCGQFGRDVFTRRAIIQPHPDFFPDKYDGTERTLPQLFERVCGYMDVSPDRIDLQLYRNNETLWLVNDQGQYLPTAAGLYHSDGDRTVVALDAAQLGNPMDLVGTIAHELAHERLLGEGRVSQEIFDNELLTDLTVVFHGLGIFLANSPRAWPSQISRWPGTDIRRPEYMTHAMFAYALAHFAWWRQERKPTWAAHLRPDSKAAFRAASHYLWETGDSTFAPPVA